jgi:hypothetical protein
MGNPVPFRTKKGEVWSPWKALVGGKLLELGPGDTMTQEEAQTALLKIIPDIPLPKKTTLGDTSKTTEIPASPFFDSTSLPATDASGKPEKPKPGEFRKNGLAELSPAKLQKFRDQVAGAIATGNVSLDRALVSIFRDKVPILAPEQYMLLSSGWELACEQYFVNGVPPAWIIILLGNALVCTSLYERSDPKPEPKEDDDDRPTGNSNNRSQEDK